MNRSVEDNAAVQDAFRTECTQKTVTFFYRAQQPKRSGARRSQTYGLLFPDCFGLRPRNDDMN